MSGMGVASVSARTSMYPIPDVPSFGIYQLAIPEWQAYTYNALIHAQNPVRTYIDELDLPAGSSERFGIHSTYATTFVEHRDTRGHEGLPGLDFGSVIERVGNLISSDEVVAVPITDLEWRASRIVAPFDQKSVEYKRLLDQQAAIEQILSDAGMEEPPVNSPHHTSLGGISFQFDAPPLHTKIYRKERAEITQMMSRRLTKAGIDSVELGELIVGENYTTPYAAADWLISSVIEIEPHGGLAT